MKTALNFDDELLREAKARAARDGDSLTRLIERALKLYLRTDRVGETRPTYRWEPVTQEGPPRPDVDFTKREDWIDRLAEGSAPWAIPVFCLGEFLRVMTHRRDFSNPHSVAEARRAVEDLVASPSVTVLRPGERFTALLLDAVVEGRAHGNRAFDAQIVALCREWSVARLLTYDPDFARWRGMKVETPGD